MRKPVIGLMPLWDEKLCSYWMLPGYMDGITAAGGIPVMLPPDPDEEALLQLFRMCGGFLLTGGHDLSPSLYGEEPLAECGLPAGERDRLEPALLKLARQENKPVFGICRGLQLINAVLGGTLYQDLPTQHPSETNHHMAPPYDRAAHENRILPGTPLHSLLKTDTLNVNSYHHQAIKDLAPCLEAMAVSEDGLVEAVRDPAQRFLWAVQWHPEFALNQPSSRALFTSFVNACK